MDEMKKIMSRVGKPGAGKGDEQRPTDLKVFRERWPLGERNARIAACVSACCKSKGFRMVGVTTHYYVCDVCGQPCDVIGAHQQNESDSK